MTGVLVVFCNILILLVCLKTDVIDRTHVNINFFYSLTCADLALGLGVLPLSFVTSRSSGWAFPVWMCDAQAYAAAYCWIVSLYSLMWLSIDHYVAVRKGDRYENIMTDTKALCWVLFTWFGALLYCCPPLLDIAHGRYYSEAFICVVDWKAQEAYLIISSILIAAPPAVAILVANAYVCTGGFKESAVQFEISSSRNSRPTAFIRNIIVASVFLLAWLPWMSMKVYEMMYEFSFGSTAHFVCMWLGVGNSLWKFVVYVCFDPDFRRGIAKLYLKTFRCRSPWSTERISERPSSIYSVGGVSVISGSRY